MNRLCRSGVVASLLLMSVGSPTVAQAASAGGTCKEAGRTVVDSGVSLRCMQTKSGLKWRKFTPPVVASQPATTTAPVVVTPAVSVKATMLNQSGVIAVTTNVVGTVYVAEVSVKVAKVSDIENAGSYLWVSAPITKVGVNEVSVDIDAIINGNYRVYVANSKGVLSAASSNMVVVSLARTYDRVAAQSWSHQFGSTHYDDAISIAVDNFGNVYVAGTSNGFMYIQGDDTGNPDYDVFVKKFDASGNQLATLQIGTTTTEWSPFITIDNFGNVLVAGSTRGILGGVSNQGDFDVFVAKLNSSLVLQGAITQIGTTGYENASSIATDVNGNVYVSGFTDGAFVGNSNQGLYDGFVAKFNSSLVLQGTVTQFGTANVDAIFSSMAVDSSGSVYVAGSTSGAFVGNSNQGLVDGFVAKFNSSLVLQGTVKQFGSTDEVHIFSIVVDGSGNVYVAGSTYGAFAGNTNLGGGDGFVAKFNSSLVLQGTVKQFGSTEDDNIFSVVVDRSGNVYVAGSTYGAFAGTTNQGDIDCFVAKFNSSLVLQGTINEFGSSGDDQAWTIAVDGEGSIYVAGYTSDVLFGSSAGYYDAFLMKVVA